MIEDLSLEIAKKVLNQLEMSLPIRPAVVSFDVELHHEKNYNMGYQMFLS